MRVVGRRDGYPINALYLPDGRVFVDPEPAVDPITQTAHRGGPDFYRHHCRFEDYGLEGFLRCKKCGLVKETSDVIKPGE